MSGEVIPTNVRIWEVLRWLGGGYTLLHLYSSVPFRLFIARHSGVVTFLFRCPYCHFATVVIVRSAQSGLSALHNQYFLCGLRTSTLSFLYLQRESAGCRSNFGPVVGVWVDAGHLILNGNGQVEITTAAVPGRWCFVLRDLWPFKFRRENLHT